jgi:hypothetical protein
MPTKVHFLRGFGQNSDQIRVKGGESQKEAMFIIVRLSRISLLESCKTVRETEGFLFLGLLPDKPLKKIQVYFWHILYRHKNSEPSV